MKKTIPERRRKKEKQRETENAKSFRLCAKDLSRLNISLEQKLEILIFFNLLQFDKI